MIVQAVFTCWRDAGSEKYPARTMFQSCRSAMRPVHAIVQVLVISYQRTAGDLWRFCTANSNTKRTLPSAAVVAVGGARLTPSRSLSLMASAYPPDTLE